VLTTIITDLTLYIGKILDYLAYHNRTARSRITINERFAFSLSDKDRKLEYYLKIYVNAFYLSSYIFSSYILDIYYTSVSIIVYSTYKIIRAIPLPSYLYTNVFTFVKVNHPLIR